jgi:hypothetical protein
MATRNSVSVPKKWYLPNALLIFTIGLIHRSGINKHRRIKLSRTILDFKMVVDAVGPENSKLSWQYGQF